MHRVNGTNRVAERSSARRRFLGQLALSTAFFSVPGAFAEELTRKTLTRTAWVEEGPFYPPQLPLDTDNDLVIVNDSVTPAVGQITHLSGRLLNANGGPVRGATIEIWEADSAGVYLADRSSQARFDAHFQGFGRFLTGSTGDYYFRTIKPTAYSGRPAPHIHFKVKLKGQREWTTQLFMKGAPGNERDMLFSRLRGPGLRETVTAEFTPVKGSRIGELAARFDIVLGMTVQDEEAS
jgi:protocatechuate 3,4-dioxygenase, beta subunit